MTDQQKRECLAKIARLMLQDAMAPNAYPELILLLYRSRFERLREEWHRQRVWNGQGD